MKLKGKSVFFKETKKKLLNITAKNTCDLLLEKKIISKVTGENFPCVSSLGQKELFKLERIFSRVFRNKRLRSSSDSIC